MISWLKLELEKETAAPAPWLGVCKGRFTLWLSRVREVHEALVLKTRTNKTTGTILPLDHKLASSSLLGLQLLAHHANRTIMTIMTTKLMPAKENGVLEFPRISSPQKVTTCTHYPSKPSNCVDKKVIGLDRKVGLWALPKVKGRDEICTVHVRSWSTRLANMASHVIILRYVLWHPLHVALLND